jgi:cell wall-associated NlpC family hydrolase
VVEPEPVAPAPAQAAALHALGLVGTPYRYGGNTPETGFDCSGLIGYVYWHAAGQRAPRTVAGIAQWGQPVARHELRTGDLVVFGARGRSPHAGIYVGEGRFVHAPSTGGTVRLDVLHARHWAAQPVEFRRP